MRTILNRLSLLSKICYGTIRSNLLWITIFITERCNSRYKTCGIWKKRNPVDMSFDLFRSIINDVSNGVYINITGGEPLLHPKISDMLTLLSTNSKSYTLFSNGINAEKLIRIIRRRCVKKLVLSCDGQNETYKRVRGVDNYKNVVKIVDELHDEVSINLEYTINPLNTKEDLIKVKRFCDSRGIHLAVGVYDNSEYFDTTIKKERLYDADGLTTYPVNRYIRLYNNWLRGNLRLPCYSTRFSCAILPKGEVLICQGKRMVLGNLNKHPLKDIWDYSKRSGILRKYKDCNGCWLLCQRSYDVV